MPHRLEPSSALARERPWGPGYSAPPPAPRLSPACPPYGGDGGLGERGPAPRPWLRRLERRRRAQHEGVGMPPADDLQPHRKALRRKSAGHVGGRLAREIEWIHERDPIEEPQRAAFGVGRTVVRAS